MSLRATVTHGPTKRLPVLSQAPKQSILTRSARPLVHEAPMSSCQDGKRCRSEFSAKAMKPCLVQSDASRKTVPFRRELGQELPPTLKGFTLHGKVGVVTGAGRGLGFNMAQGLTEAGIAGLAVVDANQELGEKAVEELSAGTGADVRFYKLDVTDDRAVLDAVADIVQHFGRIDTLISSAGIADSNIPAESYTPGMFRRLLDINLTGTFLIAQACARHMLAAQTRGSLIFVASMSGTIVNYPQEQCAYNASKAAVAQLAKSLAAEWARHGIRVNSISPGYMDTALNRQPGLEQQKRIWRERTPMGRLGGSDELNCLAVYLAGGGSEYMTGANILIDGGYTLW